MRKEDLLILLLAIALLLAAILTFLRGGEPSKHGTGAFLSRSENSLAAMIFPERTGEDADVEVDSFYYRV